VKAASDRNARLAWRLAGIVGGMLALAYAASPLYDLLCRTTGFAGTPLVAQEGERPVLSRTVAVRFDSNVDPNLSWRFQPLEREVKVGWARSWSSAPPTSRNGRSSAPRPTTSHDRRARGSPLQCFCFTEQLRARRSVDMPVVFFVDPEMDKDRRYDNVRTITPVHLLRGEDGAGEDLARQRAHNGTGRVDEHGRRCTETITWSIPARGALGAIVAFLLAMGAALGMHPDMLGTGVERLIKAVEWWIIAPGFLIIFAVMFWGGAMSSSIAQVPRDGQLGLRYGMILFIASEVLFFAAFFWAFFDSALYPGAPEMPVRAEATGGVWPPKGTYVIAPFDLPFMNTLILLLSGTTVTWAHHAILEGNKRDAVRGLLLTVILGICFT
jgi:cytochrome c oxidase assembly protein Cox11